MIRTISDLWSLIFFIRSGLLGERVRESCFTTGLWSYELERVTKNTCDCRIRKNKSKARDKSKARKSDGFWEKIWSLQLRKQSYKREAQRTLLLFFRFFELRFIGRVRQGTFFATTKKSDISPWREWHSRCDWALHNLVMLKMNEEYHSRTSSKEFSESIGVAVLSD